MAMPDINFELMKTLITYILEADTFSLSRSKTMCRDNDIPDENMLDMMEDGSILFFRPRTQRDCIRARFLLHPTIMLATNDIDEQRFPDMPVSVVPTNKLLESDDYRLSLYELWLRVEERDVNEDANMPGIKYYDHARVYPDAPDIAYYPQEIYDERGDGGNEHDDGGFIEYDTFGNQLIRSGNGNITFL
jgi:hypothetical protein